MGEIHREVSLVTSQLKLFGEVKSLVPIETLLETAQKKKRSELESEWNLSHPLDNTSSSPGLINIDEL